MTLLKIDGFDSYADSTDLQRRDWGLTGSGVFFDTTGRMGTGKCLRVTNSMVSLQTPIPGVTQILAGFAYKYTTAGLTCVCQMWEGSIDHCSLVMEASGQLAAKREINTAITGGTSVQTLAINTWYYIEILMTVKNSMGANEWICKVNGEEWINLPVASDTQDNGTGICTAFALGGNLGNRDRQYDDFYLLDPNSGFAPQNTFLGDCRVDTLRPDGNGTTSDFVGSDADSVDNYLLVDEVTPDGDTTYIESSTPAELDLHSIESLPVTPDTIYGVNAVSIARKTDAGTRSARHVVRTGAANFEGAEFSPGTPDYGGFENIWEENPNTVAPWIEADITGLETGIKVES